MRDACEANRRLGRGINFGGALDAGGDAAQRSSLDERHFDVLPQAGLCHGAASDDVVRPHADTGEGNEGDRSAEADEHEGRHNVVGDRAVDLREQASPATCSSSPMLERDRAKPKKRVPRE